jgi:hypothetical protein
MLFSASATITLRTNGEAGALHTELACGLTPLARFRNTTFAPASSQTCRLIKGLSFTAIEGGTGRQVHQVRPRKTACSKQKLSDNPDCCTRPPCIQCAQAAFFLMRLSCRYRNGIVYITLPRRDAAGKQFAPCSLSRFPSPTLPNQDLAFPRAQSRASSSANQPSGTLGAVERGPARPPIERKLPKIALPVAVRPLSGSHCSLQTPQNAAIFGG